MYFQNYNPLGNVFLSTLVAAIPILTLLYFIALHPHRDDRECIVGKCRQLGQYFLQNPFLFSGFRESSIGDRRD